MISLVDSLAWDAADLTGNSALVGVGTDLYVVGGRRGGSSTQALYKSVDHGLTWGVVATIPTPAGTLDPAVAADGTTLHIVHSRPQDLNPLLSDVLHYTFDTLTATLSSPQTLMVGTKAQAAYDIVPLAAGGALVVTAGQEISIPSGHAAKYVLLAFEIPASGTPTSTVILETHWASGDTCGSISLVAPGGSAPVELFYTEHPRVFAFRDTTVQVLKRNRTAPGVWSAPQVLTTYGARFTDDKLTVLAAPNGDRLLAQAFHTQSKTFGRQTHILYGVGIYDAGTTSWAWKFSEIQADGYNLVKEPVVGCDGQGTYLSYLICPRDQQTKTYARTGFLRVANVNLTDMTTSLRVGAWSGLRFKWLRGGKGAMDTQSKWGVVGIAGSDTNELAGGAATYLSEFNLPPQAVLKPTTLEAKRGVDYTLDATDTLDPDLDSLTYTWSSSNPSPYIHIFPIEGGRRAILRVDKAIGPALLTFNVSVRVDDGVGTHASDPGATATTVVTVPFNAAPEIVVDSPVAVLRNTTIHLAATITDADLDSLTLLWEQVSGTDVVIKTPTQAGTDVEVYRMHPAGEAVTLRITADDGVNTVVSADVVLNVSPIADRDLDAGRMARAFYSVP